MASSINNGFRTKAKIKKNNRGKQVVNGYLFFFGMVLGRHQRDHQPGTTRLQWPITDTIIHIDLE
jgi:hypothetical protein